eukprot:6499256-Alexandrium_andersonii.AAC.1
MDNAWVEDAGGDLPGRRSPQALELLRAEGPWLRRRRARTLEVHARKGGGAQRRSDRTFASARFNRW